MQTTVPSVLLLEVRSTSDLQVRTQISPPTINSSTWTSFPVQAWQIPLAETGQSKENNQFGPAAPPEKKPPSDHSQFPPMRPAPAGWQQHQSSPMFDPTTPVAALPEVKRFKEGPISACSRTRCLVVLTSFTTCHRIPSWNSLVSASLKLRHRGEHRRQLVVPRRGA